MPVYRVSLGFAKYGDPELNEFVGGIIVGMTDNPAFPAPPVSLADLAVAREAYVLALVDAFDGGVKKTAVKNAARVALIALLRDVANYVQGIARNDLAMLLSSGFLANNRNMAQVPLVKPAILAIVNEGSQALVVRLTPVSNARLYQVRLNTAGNGDWQDAGTFSQARRIKLTALTPGTVYRIQARALGGSTGYSDWCDSVSHMSL